ncbi:hypothetical protein EVAR_9913_1 [Eumeta japonica]|uniref:Uncharacterized protein n=1 Tax=Eumeta variegata TaxID=151549 RepID=A0A4C1TQE0_EUMVA|nr:hypothetical protein EVAR_9913_1 [Eumeta japonica]
MNGLVPPASSSSPLEIRTRDSRTGDIIGELLETSYRFRCWLFPPRTSVVGSCARYRGLGAADDRRR